MKAKFTKGPWVKCKRGETLIGEKEKEIGIYDCGLVNVNKSEESVANAHLIAAAPEMYAMLEMVLYVIDFLTDEVSTDDIKDLLSKARGE